MQNNLFNLIANSHFQSDGKSAFCKASMYSKGGVAPYIVLLTSRVPSPVSGKLQRLRSVTAR